MTQPLTDTEAHTKIEGDDGKFRVIVIPQNPWAPIREERLVGGGDNARLQQLKDLVGGYVEAVRTIQLVRLSTHLDVIGKSKICAIVDEDGWSNHKRVNSRTSRVFYDGDLAGDVVLLLEEPVEDGSYNFATLPDSVTIEGITKWVLSQTDKG